MSEGGAPRAPATAATTEPDLLRPFLLTMGRTDTGSVYVNVETLVTVTDLGRRVHDNVQFEQRTILELTENAISVAELSVALAVPLGVAKVLAGEMAEGGLVNLTEAASGANADTSMIRRLIDGVRTL